MSKRVTIIIILSILISCMFLFAQRGLKVVVKTSEGSSLELYKQYRALIIGVSDYLYWPRLPNAVKDAREVAAILQERGFITRVLENPNSEEIKGALDRLVFRESGVGDGVLIYFAGHGETMKLADGTELGYIIPKDCPLKLKDSIGFTRKAISMEDIQTYSLQLKSKHLLALFDSCFSGSIFALGRAAPADITYKTAFPVRQYITGGSADEIVPDKSIFKECFLDALKGEADANKDGYVTGSELGLYLESNVVKYSRNAQHPQYGKIRNLKLDKGDFVFVLSNTIEILRDRLDSAKPEVVLEPRYGNLEISIDITGAKVYLDDKYQGITKEGYVFAIKKLPIKTYSIRISKEKFKDYVTSVKITEGKSVKIEAKLESIATSIQPDILFDSAKAKLEAMKKIVIGEIVTSWRSDDGIIIRGILYKSSKVGYKKIPMPCIVKLNDIMIDKQGGNHQLLNSILCDEGYVVFTPEYRDYENSSKKLKSQVSAIRNSVHLKHYEDIISGVEELVRDGYVDPDKLGIIGWGYGGYLANFTSVHTDWFRAVISVAGIADIEQLWIESSNIKIINDLFKELTFKDRRALSPVSYIKNARVPTLLIHGKKDFIISSNQSEIFYQHLIQIGVKSKLILFEDEYHEITKPGNILRFFSESKKWFNKYILNKASQDF